MHLFRRCAPDPEAPPPASVATFAILFQIAGMMGMSGGAKLLDEAWRAGDGVYYALTAELYATGLAHAVREARWLVTALNWIVIAFELLGPVLLFLPWKNQRWRLAYGLGVIGMNLGFWLCLRVGIFSWAAICGGVLFVPGLVWDRLGWRPRGDARAGAPDLPRPVAGVAAALFAVMLYGNTHPRIRALVPNAIDDVVQAIGLNQRGWSMFAPTAKDHGWFVFAATTAAGRRIDLYEGGAPLTEARPPLISADFPTYRWRKYLYHLKNGGPIFRGLLVQYLCRSWNRTHRGEDRVTRLEIVYWREETLPDYRTTPPERRVLVRGDCPPDSFQQ